MKNPQPLAGMGGGGLAGFIPLLVTVVFAFLMLLPIGTGASSFAFPNLPMIAVFYWTCHRPLSMPLGAAVIAGLIMDLWMNVPLGLNMLMLLLLRAGVLAQLKHFKGRGAMTYWMVFAVIIVGIFVTGWVASSFAENRFIPPLPLIQQYAVTVFAYPLVAWILGRIRRSLL